MPAQHAVRLAERVLQHVRWAHFRHAAGYDVADRLVELEAHVAAFGEVELGGAQPALDAVGRGDRLPHLLDRVLDAGLELHFGHRWSPRSGCASGAPSLSSHRRLYGASHSSISASGTGLT